MPGLVSRFGCRGVRRIPGIIGIAIGQKLKRTSRGTGTLRSSLGRLTLVANRHPMIAHTGGTVTNFGVHRNVPINMTMALHSSQVCSFLGHLVGLTLPHVHSFHKVDPGDFSNHKGCALNLQRRLVFPRVSCSNVSRVHNVSVAVIAATGASRRKQTLLGTLNVPFQSGWREFVHRVEAVTTGSAVTSVLAHVQGTGLTQRRAIGVPSAQVAQDVTGMLGRRKFVASCSRTARSNETRLMVTLGCGNGAHRPVVHGLAHIDGPNLQICSGQGRLPQILNNVNVTVISASDKVVASHSTHHRKVNNRILYCI